MVPVSQPSRNINKLSRFQRDCSVQIAQARAACILGFLSKNEPFLGLVAATLHSPSAKASFILLMADRFLFMSQEEVSFLKWTSAPLSAIKAHITSPAPLKHHVFFYPNPRPISSIPSCSHFKKQIHKTNKNIFWKTTLLETLLSRT